MMVSFFLGDEGVFGRAAVVSMRRVGSGWDRRAWSRASSAGRASGPTLAARCAGVIARTRAARAAMAVSSAWWNCCVWTSMTARVKPLARS